MTPKDRLVTVKEGEARDVVLQKMHEKRVESAGGGRQLHLLGMITVKDFQKAERSRTPVKTSTAVCAWARRSVPAPATKSALTRWWRLALTSC